jgi:hypothetical protein
MQDPAAEPPRGLAAASPPGREEVSRQVPEAVFLRGLEGAFRQVPVAGSRVPPGEVSTRDRVQVRTTATSLLDVSFLSTSRTGR